jgi:hypothetical protein
MSLVFAKSINGVAPSSFGNVNSAATGCHELPLHLVGGMELSGTASEGALTGAPFGNIHVSTLGMDSDGVSGFGLPMVLDLEPDSGTYKGYDRLYVAAFTKGAFDFSTGVLADYSSGAPTADSTKTIVLQTIDARNCFQVGDIVYVHDQNTALGTVASVLTAQITLEANNAVAVADNDEIINANPIKFIFGFEK